MSYRFNQLFVKVLALSVITLFPLLNIQVSGQFKPSVVTRSNNIMIIDGKKYYMHEVKEGHTLFSVSRAYNVTQKVLSQENPNVPHISSGTLPLGVVIRIPYVEIIESEVEEIKDYDRFHYHVVEPKETLYSLSKLYKVHYNKIIENNPGVENNLPTGMEIKIPKTQVGAVREAITAQDSSFIYHKVKKGENTIQVANLYGIRIKDLKDANPGIRWGLVENDIIRIPAGLVNKDDILFNEDAGLLAYEEDRQEEEKILPAVSSECLEKLRPHNDQVFDVVFMLPLFLDTNETLHQSDSLRYSNYDIYDPRFLDFLEGALIAIDSLKEYGLKMNVHIYDTERDPEVVEDLFDSGKINRADLLIGPVYRAPLKVASGYASELHIPLVSPLSSSGEGLDENPYLFQVNPTQEIEYELSSLFLSRFHNMNIIMVQDTSSIVVKRKYGSKIFDYLCYKLNPEDLLTGRVQFHPSFSDDLPEKALIVPVEDMLSIGKENLVIIPSDNEIFVTDITNKLNALALRYKITVFGRPEWGEYEALELEYLYKLNLHYYTNFSNPFVDYNDSLTLDFCKKYRLNWNNEPSKFSFQGFDVTYYFFKALYLFGNDFTSCIDCWNTVLNHPTMQTEFCFQKKGRDRGFENQALSIVHYNPETFLIERIRSSRPRLFTGAQDNQTP